MSRQPEDGARGHLRRWAPRVVAAVAALACLADQPPRWTMDTKVPVTPAAPSGKALRVSVEASHEPSLFVKSGGQQTTWEDTSAPRTSWPGKAELFVDAGGVVDSASIGDRCTSGGGLCSGCDPPPGAFLKVLAITEVDIWSTSATTTVAAGAASRIDIEIDATREPHVVSVPPSSGSCSTLFWSSSPLASGASSPSASVAPAEPSAPPSAPPSAQPPPSKNPRSRIFSFWVDAAATITATIRGPCASGPCPPPANEAIAIVRTVRVP